MSRGSWVAVLIFLTIVFMASLWMIDLSVSAMQVSMSSSGEAKLTNGFWVRNPIETYHIALWMAVASFFSATMVAIKALVGGEEH